MAELFTNFKAKMFVKILSQVQTKLSYLFVIIFVCFMYFNSSLISEPIVIFFQVSSFVGQVLVSDFLTVFKCSFEIVKLIYSFFQVMYEDSLIFVKDATEKFAFAISLLKELYLFLEECSLNFLRTVFLVAENVLHIFEFIHHSLVMVVERIHLIGLTIWLFFTSIPEVVVSIIIRFDELFTKTIIEVLTFVYKLILKIIENIEKIYLFLFDVPLDSVYGLIIGAILLTVICIILKNICYLISRVLLKLYSNAICFGISLWSGSFLEKKSRTHNVPYNYEDERLCIICQHHLKEVIIFPCKHLCLCGDCNIKLLNNHSLCPVCRSDITGTLKVYI